MVLQAAKNRANRLNASRREPRLSKFGDLESKRNRGPPRAMNIVILAAGQGKRMRSSLPKVLHPVAGRPMLAHVIAAARQACTDVANITVVIGHGADAVREAFPGEPGLHFVLQ